MGARNRRLRSLTKNFLRRAEEAGRGKSLNEQAMLDVHAVEDAGFVHWCQEKLRELKTDVPLP